MADKKEKDLTKVSDAAYIRALDSNGNPVLISKADLAQVAAELIGTATASKDGLISASIFRIGLQYESMAQSRIYKVARLDANYTSFTMVGADVMRGRPFHVSVISKIGKLWYCGDKGEMLIKSDSDRNIYVSVPTGSQIEAKFILNVAVIEAVQAFPDDAVDVAEYVSD